MLYKIDDVIREGWEAVDPETGEIVNEKAHEAFEELLRKQEEMVIEEMSLYAKNKRAEAVAFKAEKQAFAERQATAEREAEGAERYVATLLAGEKFETVRVKITWRKSQVAEFTGSIEDLPEECIRYAMPEVNKTELKKLLKAGTEIPGAKLVTKNNMQIK